MRNKIVISILIMAVSLMATGCCLVHDWADATCQTPQTCNDCGKTMGEPLEHEYLPATCVEPPTCKNCGHIEGEPAGHLWIRSNCTTPRTCSVCGAVDGDVAEHTWIEATCIMPRHCSVCGITDGYTVGHQWLSADYNSPRTCAVCGATEGEKLSAFANSAFSDITYSLSSGSKQDYSTITGIDNRISNGTVTVESYNKYAEDSTHPYREGYEWREVKVKFSMDKPSRVMWGYTDEYLGLSEYARTDYITYADGTREKVNATQTFQSAMANPSVTPAASTDANATPAPTPDSVPDKYISYVSQAVQVPIKYKSLIFYVCNADYEIDHIIDDSFLYMKMD